MADYLCDNEDCSLPGTIVFVECEYTETEDALCPGQRLRHFKRAHGIAGRIEGNEWTREKSTTVDSPDAWWGLLNTWRRLGTVTWVFGRCMSQQLTLLGMWSLMESGTFTLVRHPSKNLSQVKSDKLRRKLSRPEPGLLVEADPPMILQCWHKQGWKIVFLDSANYCVPLQMINSRHHGTGYHNGIQLNLDHDGQQQSHTNGIENLRDCVLELVTWHRSQQLGRFAWTASGCGLSFFKSACIDEPIVLPESQEARDLERRAYYNGRTEALWVGEVLNGKYYPPEGVDPDPRLFGGFPSAPFIQVDSRSFYGAVGFAENMPYKCIANGNSTGCREFPPDFSDGSYLAEVLIVTDEECYPVRIEKGTVYARGTIRTVLCGRELQAAVAKDRVCQVGSWRRYALGPVFHDYCRRLYSLREDAERDNRGVVAAVCKTMLATLHGKFLQRRTRWEIDPEEVAPGPWQHWHRINPITGESVRYRSIGWDVQRENPAGDAPHAFPAIAAWWTAAGREWIRHWLSLTGHDNALYVGTDSIILTAAGYARLRESGVVYDQGIGSMRVIRQANNVHVRAANCYQIGEFVCMSGVCSASADLAGGTWTLRERDTLRAIIARGGTDRIITRRKVLTIPLRDCGTRVGVGGWVEPITLNME